MRGDLCRHAGCLANELLMMLRAEKKTAKDVYLYDTIGSDKEGNEINLIDVIEHYDEDVVERVTTEGRIARLQEYMERVLSERERDILCMRYGLDGRREVTQREIAAMYHISRSYVSRIEKKALQKLRKCYENI